MRKALITVMSVLLLVGCFDSSSSNATKAQREIKNIQGSVSNLADIATDEFKSKVDLDQYSADVQNQINKALSLCEGVVSARCLDIRDKLNNSGGSLPELTGSFLKKIEDIAGGM